MEMAAVVDAKRTTVAKMTCSGLYSRAGDSQRGRAEKEWITWEQGMLEEEECISVEQGMLEEQECISVEQGMLRDKKELIEHIMNVERGRYDVRAVI